MNRLVVRSAPLMAVLAFAWAVGTAALVATPDNFLTSNVAHAAKNPCNPCNPCAAKAKNPCNPCNPCAAKKQ